jgi:hypothetical protein
MRKGFIVAQVLGHGSLQPVFSDDDGLMFFDTTEATQAEINDCLSGIKDAVSQGDMDPDSMLSEDDYEILPATLEGTTIRTSYDGIHYIMDRSEDDWKVDNNYINIKYI